MRMPHWDLCDTFAYLVMPVLFVVGVVIVEVRVRRTDKKINGGRRGFDVNPTGRHAPDETGQENNGQSPPSRH